MREAKFGPGWLMKVAPNASEETLSDLQGKSVEVHDAGICLARFGGLVGIVVPRPDGSVLLVKTSLRLLARNVQTLVDAAQEREPEAASG